MAKRYTYDAFLSHYQADKPQIQSLAERLHTWFDKWAVQPGDAVYLDLECGLDVSRTPIICIWSAALRLDWAKQECTAELLRDPPHQTAVI